ncbi:MAG: TIGR02680 family protein, partial [Trebonia sp.]
MRAHRNTDGVRMSFYVTGKRLGVDFGLLSSDSRPLTEKQLRAVLEPEAYRRTATEYRDLVDQRLFGLGRERHAQLLDLLLALRRPLLAKDLDPGKVSDTLTSGLSPVDDDLVQQAARDFENLAAVQKLFDDLTAANAAVAEFRAHYETYLRAHVKFALDRVQARVDVAAEHASRIALATSQRSAAATAEAEAEAERNARRDEGEQLQGRLNGLKNSEEYKAQGLMEAKRNEVIQRAQEVAAARRRLDGDKRRITDLESEAAKLSRRAAQARNEAQRHSRDLADAGERSGITGDGFGPLDTGEDLLVTAKARVLARRDDVAEVRRLLEAIREARSRRAYAEQELGRKETAEQEQQLACTVADQRLSAARRAASGELAAWAERWTEMSETTGPLAEALEHVGEAGAVSLAEVFDELTA